MRLSLLIFVVVGLIAPTHSLLAQDLIRYDISFANRVHHEARVTITYEDIEADVLELRMSRSSPGRYALHEFAKNVYQVEAEDRNGRALAISRPSPYQWNISNHQGYAKVSYTLFADRADGTYSQIDSSHAHLNMPATFMWARNFVDSPVQLTFSDLDPAWKIATQLVPGPQSNIYTARDFQYLMDSPTEISDFSLRSFTIESDEKEYTINLAVHHNASEADVDVLAEMAESVVKEQVAVYGEPPEFDYGSYTFIADYLPYVNGDGMEHRNSTILSNTNNLGEDTSAFLGTLSHEFFHAWNVERIRPRSLEPFDFERANMSGELWFAEGFTQYYGNLLLRRSANRSDEQYLNVLSGIVNAITHATGRQYFSPIEMSMQAPFVDAATALDPVAFRNTFFSYYTYGAALALALDLTLRSEYELDLDGYMALLWQNFGKPENPYTIADLQNTLGIYASNPSFSESFFQRYIYASELPDYAPLLAHAGMDLQFEAADEASLGNISIDFEDRKATIINATLVGSPLYLAGLTAGDEIKKIGRYNIRSERQWNRMLRRFDPGETAAIEFISRGVERTSEITFGSNQSLQVTLMEDGGGALPAEQATFRLAWLGSKVGDD